MFNAGRACSFSVYEYVANPMFVSCMPRASQEVSVLRRARKLQGRRRHVCQTWTYRPGPDSRRFNLNAAAVAGKLKFFLVSVHNVKHSCTIDVNKPLQVVSQ